MRDRIPLPEDEPILADMAQLVGIAIWVVVGLGLFVFGMNDIVAAGLLGLGVIFYLAGTISKAREGV